MQSSNISFSNVTRNSMTVSFTKGDGEKRIVIARERYAIPTNIDFTGVELVCDNSGSYLNAKSIAGCKILYIGDGESVNAIDLNRYNIYYFKVLEIKDGIIDQSENTTNPRARWTLR